MSAPPKLLDEGWWEASIARAYAVYPNEGVRPTASLMARTGRYAVEYMEQAPAILVYATWGVTPKSYADRAIIAQRYGSAIRRGPRLKDLLAEFHAPYPIRKLRGNVVIPSNLSTILSLRNVPPSVLSQAIPDPKYQVKWIRALRAWRNAEGRFQFLSNSTSLWHWAVYALSLAIQENRPNVEQRVGDILDFIVRGGNALNPTWTYQGALAAAERWHRELAEKEDQERFLRQHGFGFNDVRDYWPLPEKWHDGEFSVTALQSGLDLFLEGKAMRHCVATYVREVMLGGTRIYSIKRGEDRVATIELHPRGEYFTQAQLKGPCNSHPPKQVRELAGKFLDAANKAIRQRNIP